MSLRVVSVPCLSDNYAYLVVAADGGAAVVDPSEPAPVLAALAQEGATLREIWCTHHHLDHVGGVEALVERTPRLVVRGSTYDVDHRRIPRATNAHPDGDTFAFGGHTVRVLAIPGHTLGAIAFVVDGALFSGDTLFLGGCGRVFEGTMPMMAQSMRILRELDPELRVYCGHEYTAANLRFARTIEPGSEDIARALEAATEKSASGVPTVPGLLGDELRVNPFLRFDRPELAAGVSADESFARLREAKNSFQG